MPRVCVDVLSMPEVRQDASRRGDEFGRHCRHEADRKCDHDLLALSGDAGRGSHEGDGSDLHLHLVGATELLGSNE